MKKLSIGCIIMGIISIILAALNALTVFLPSEPFRYFIKSILPLPGLNEFIEIISHFRGIELLAPFITAIFSNANILSNNIILSLIGYFLSMLLAISGIGTIWEKSWGRKFGYIYSMVIIVIAIISVPVFLIHYFRLPSGGPFDEGINKMVVELYFVLLFFNLLYPLVLLIFFSRPKIKEKFKLKK